MTDPLISSLQGKLIVSCQAYVGEPMRHPETMAQVALSAERGGALSAAKALPTSLPSKARWKSPSSAFERGTTASTSPTLRHARACIAAGWTWWPSMPRHAPPRRSQLRGDRKGFAR
ncbi:MAG: hypothetical protein ACLSDQ_13565 [Adlercreutzia equolifaciens]